MILQAGWSAGQISGRKDSDEDQGHLLHLCGNVGPWGLLSTASCHLQSSVKGNAFLMQTHPLRLSGSYLYVFFQNALLANLLS